MAEPYLASDVGGVRKVLQVAFDCLNGDLGHIQIVVLGHGFQFLAEFEGKLEGPRHADGAPTASIQ